MNLTLRAQKGAPLTIEEMDNNFLYLKERIKECGQKGGSKIHIRQNGHLVEFLNEQDESLGNFMIPILLPSYQGKWMPSLTYQLGQWVRATDGIYGCLKSHTSADFEKEKENWQLIIGDM